MSNLKPKIRRGSVDPIILRELERAYDQLYERIIPKISRHPDCEAKVHGYYRSVEDKIRKERSNKEQRLPIYKRDFLQAGIRLFSQYAKIIRDNNSINAIVDSRYPSRAVFVKDEKFDSDSDCVSLGELDSDDEDFTKKRKRHIIIDDSEDDEELKKLKLV